METVLGVSQAVEAQTNLQRNKKNEPKQIGSKNSGALVADINTEHATVKLDIDKSISVL